MYVCMLICTSICMHICLCVQVYLCMLLPLLLHCFRSLTVYCQFSAAFPPGYYCCLGCCCPLLSLVGCRAAANGSKYLRNKFLLFACLMHLIDLHLPSLPSGIVLLSLAFEIPILLIPGVVVVAVLLASAHKQTLHVLQFLFFHVSKFSHDSFVHKNDTKELELGSVMRIFDEMANSQSRTFHFLIPFWS